MAELMTGYSRSQLLTNRDFYSQLNPNRYTPDNLKPNCAELKIKVKDDRECWLNCCWELTEWKSKPAIMITAIDVTKYKQREAKTHQALMAEKELCQNKARFVSMVSHEFRNLLNTISFSTSLLKCHLDHWNRAKQLEYLNHLQTAAEQLCNSIDEVTIVGKAEAGKLKFAPRSLDIDLFCHNLLMEINPIEFSDRDINYVNKSNRKTIFADKNLLRLVLVNLLGNALKYSPNTSTIKLIISCSDEQVIFKIVDRGIGIPLKEQSKIFEPFHRSSNVGDLPGNGLGLAIAKRVVELQGGQILLKSKENFGSTFTVKIPLKFPSI